MALVEWPERAAEALPPDRLEIAFLFDVAKGADYRRVEVRAFGAMVGRYARARAIEALLLQARLGRGAARISCKATLRCAPTSA